MHFSSTNGLESDVALDMGLLWVRYNVHTDNISTYHGPFRHGDVVNTT